MNTYIQLISELSIQSRGSNKYLNWYISIITKSQNRILTDYTEKHHIVPDCFYINRKRKGPKGFLEGTPNNKNNFVILKPEEHLIMHLLLTKMFNKNFVNYHSIITAAHLLYTLNNKKINNKQYAWIKQKNSIVLSERNNKRILEKTHLFANSEFQSQRSKTKIENGTFHLLSGDIQRKTNKKLVESGLHNFQSNESKKAVAERNKINNKLKSSRPLYLEIKELCKQLGVKQPQGLNLKSDQFLIEFKSQLS